MNADDFISTQLSRINETVEDDEEINNDNSDVDYPLIDLKTGLKNEIIERTKKDLKKASNPGKKDTHQRASEFSQVVIGQNKSAQFELNKAVNYFFSEQEYILEKMKKAQQKTLEDLQRIHFDRRQQMRMSYEYHNEELRQSLLKVKEEAKFLQRQEELEEAMRQKKMSINKLIVEQRNLLKETSPKLKKKYRKQLIAASTKDNIEKNDKNIKTILENNSQEKNSEINIIESDFPRSRSLLQIKAIEVTKDIMNPRTIERNMDMCLPKYDETLPIIFQFQNEERKSPFHFENKDKEISINNEKKPFEIFEDFTEPYENSSSHEELKKEDKFKTSKDIMKNHKLMKEKEIRDILSLPYVAYRRNSAGKIIELDHPPQKKEFKEPSNKDKYKIRKVLGEERNRYQESMINLTKTTEKLIQEDIRRKNLLNAPKIEIKKEIVYETTKIGPQHWMKAFVSSNIPNDVDPSSTEAIIYCRYIRAPLKTYSHLPNYLIYHTPL